MTSSSNHFGVTVTALMKELRVSQTELGCRLGTSQPNIYQMLCGKRKVTPLMVQRIVAALELPDAKASFLHAAAAKDKGYNIKLPPIE